MDCTWKKDKVIHLGRDEKALMEDSKITIMKKVKEPKKRRIDITGECTAELVKSMNSSGYYCAIKHDGLTVFVLGVDAKSAAIPAHHHGRHLRLEKAPNATVSFHIIKER